MGKILKKIMLISLTLGVIAASSLVITSWALEPAPFGEAVAPDPDAHPEAIIQVYGADVWGLRGKFAVHTWIERKKRSKVHRKKPTWRRRSRNWPKRGHATRPHRN